MRGNLQPAGGVYKGMKYWGYFTLKVCAGAALFYGLWQWLVAVMPEPAPFRQYRVARFGQDLAWTTVILVFVLLACGVFYVIIWDQRYRCRSCLRRLRMPVVKGAWNQVLFGAPQTEYICPYGHGTLEVPELQITGMEHPSWKPHDDIWKELEKLKESPK